MLAMPGERKLKVAPCHLLAPVGRLEAELMIPDSRAGAR